MFNNLFVPDRKIGEILPPFSTQTEKITDYAQQIDREWVEGSAISPNLFRANVTITASESIDHGGDVARPLHDALNWKIDRWQDPRSHGAIIHTVDLESGDRRVFQVKLERQIFDQKKGKVRKYENPSGRGQVGGFACVDLQTWQKVSDRYSVSMPNDLPDRHWYGKEFWDWVIAYNLPVFVTEGMKKALSLLSLGYVSIALSGITMGRQTLANSSVKLQEYLEIFATPGREIYFCFDAETKPKTKFDVYLAQVRTGKLFEDRGCNVKIVRLPLLSGTDKTGVDDLIVASGPIALESSIELSLPLTSYQWQFRNKSRLTYRPTIRLNAPELNLTDLPDTGLIFIASPKATGKTKAIGAAISNDRKVVMLTHLICLGRNLAKRCGVTWRGDLDSAKGFGYIDRNGGAANVDRIGLCVHSLLAINPRDYEGCTLVLDEVDQLLKTLLTNKLCNKSGKRAALLARFHELVMVAGRVIAASADVSNAEIDYLKELRGGEVCLIVNDYLAEGYAVNSIKSTTDKASIALLIEDIRAGHKVMVCTDSKGKAMSIAKILHNLELGLRVLTITSETSGGKIEADFIENINVRVTDYDVLIASPSLATGVSIETEHFTKVYGLYEGVLTDSDICQALARVRHPVERVVWCKPKGNNFSSISRSDSPVSIANTLKVTRTTEISLIRTSLRPDLIPFVDTGYSWENNPHLDLFCQLEARQNQAMWNLADNLIERLKHEGHAVKIIDADEIDSTGLGEIIKQVKQAIKIDRAEALAHAEILTGKALTDLDRKQFKTPEEIAVCAASHIADFYCVDRLTPELIEFDCEGKTRSQIQELEALLYPETAIDADVLQISKQASFRGFGTAWDLSCRELKRQIRVRSGLVELLKSGSEYVDSDLQEFADFCHYHAESIKRGLGLTIPVDQTNIWIFREMTRQLGIKTKSKRQYVDGVLFNVCWIAADCWIALLAPIERRQERRVSDPVCDRPPSVFNNLSEGAIDLEDECEPVKAGDSVWHNGYKYIVQSIEGTQAKIRDWLGSYLPISQPVSELQAW